MYRESWGIDTIFVRMTSFPPEMSLYGIDDVPVELDPHADYLPMSVSSEGGLAYTFEELEAIIERETDATTHPEL